MGTAGKVTIGPNYPNHISREIFLSTFDMECREYPYYDIMRCLARVRIFESPFHFGSILVGAIRYGGAFKEFAFMVDRNDFVNDHIYRNNFMKDSRTQIIKAFKVI